MAPGDVASLTGEIGDGGPPLGQLRVRVPILAAGHVGHQLNQVVFSRHVILPSDIGAMPSSAATARIVTASSPAASASLIAAAATAVRSYLLLGPRVPCSGMSQMDMGVSLVTSLILSRGPPYQRAMYVVLCQ